MGFGENEVKEMQGQRHKRSKSFPEKQRLGGDNIGSSPDASQRLKLDLQNSNESSKTKKKLSPKVKGHSPLKQEILELENRLQNQFDVRRALEKALGYRTSSQDGNANAISSPKPAPELIKEIAVLELEVSHLEQYLLSLYRKAFDQQISSVSPTSKQQSSCSPKSTLGGKRLDFSRTDVTPKHETSTLESRCFSFDNRLKGPFSVEKELGSNVRRCQSSLNQRSTFINRISPPEECLLDCHSQPLSIKEVSFDNRLKGPSSVEKELDSNVRRCQSSLNQRSTFINRISPPEECLLDCHSQPLSIKEVSFDNRLKGPSSVEKELDSNVRRCQSSLNQRSTFINRISPPEECLLDCHSQPLSIKEVSFDNRLKGPSSVEKELDSNVRRCQSSLNQRSTFINRISPPEECLLDCHSQPLSIKEVSFDNRLKGPSSVEKELDSNVRRCQSSLNQRSTFINRISLPEECFLDCHSQPLSIKEYMQNESSMISLADHLGTQISDHVPVTPNKLSEDMIKCVSTIYCKLADPPMINPGLSSPSSSPSSSEFSPHEQYDMWSPSFRKHPSFDVRSDNQFEFSGPYSSMVEVLHIYRNRKKGRDLELMLRNFSVLISKLEDIDPRKLTHQEKLAFWINVHNALVMHTFLAYGIPQNNGKRFLLLSKPAYNIGGRMMSVETIQNSILCSRLPRPGQILYCDHLAKNLMNPSSTSSGSGYCSLQENLEPVMSCKGFPLTTLSLSCTLLSAQAVTLILQYAFIRPKGYTKS
ncbi:PREDICTED: uncharacterized protein LOC104807562 isoform X2 [Tarenaya hassleriana]|uniref:uncharacterized protein LOC104807562 isoform X2 n=1 Tax=Tarenaya hassleriana TaxID=28532 RepID=UPI00053C1375|nr:PREDICTED: uncharacterized protein LOC104807562 isoform X2 [Tarenaya hassleriana]